MSLFHRPPADRPIPTVPMLVPLQCFEQILMTSKKIRLVTRETNGEIRTRDFDGFEDIQKVHEQVGIEDSSTDLTLRGMPVFRGLIGPMPEGRSFARYESPEVFEVLTKEWAAQKIPRRKRRRTVALEGDETTVAIAIQAEYLEVSEFDSEDDSDI